jgi:GT2 family glycosyltransferase
VRDWAVIIPSKSDAAIIDCVSSLVSYHPEITPDQIVVVDDGLSDRALSILEDVTVIRGTKPFVFARAMNQGARAEPERDIVFLGDDVRFFMKGTIDALAVQSEGIAAISPEVIGVCGQPAQRAGSTETSAPWLAFICTYIPRKAWGTVGELDERFTGYGYDDVDWCSRASEHGLQCIVDHDLRVGHIGMSSYRTLDNWRELYQQNHSIFEAKWFKGEMAPYE